MTMTAVVTTGNGGYDKLEYKQVPVPIPAEGEVLLQVLKPGGKYVTSGAIGGPLVTLDVRTLYLKDLTIMECTAWDEPVFGNLISYIERGEIRPLLAKTFPLEKIADAQREFVKKEHVGKFVLIPRADCLNNVDTEL